jgi:hypothetical protein
MRLDTTVIYIILIFYLSVSKVYYKGGVESPCRCGDGNEKSWGIENNKHIF